MATIDLSLDALKIPALDNFNPDFGTMITETQANKGGLSTFEVNSNMMLPWSYMRPKVVVEDSVTTVIEYDAKLTFSASLQAGVTLTMDAGDYEGCEVSLRNLSAYACTVEHGTFSLEIPAGGFVRILWNGTTWEADVSSTVGSGIILPPTAAAVHAAIGKIRFTSLAGVDIDQNIDYLTAAARSYTMPGNGLLVAKIIKASSGYTFTLRVNGVNVDSSAIYESYSGNAGFELKAFVKKNDVVTFLTDAPSGTQCKINKMVLLRYETFITN